MSVFNIRTIKPAAFGFRRRVQPKRKAPIIWRLVLIFLFLVIVYLLFTYVLPRVTIIIIPNTKDIGKDFNIQLTTDKGKVNNTQNIFAAEIFEAAEEAREKFKATGEKDVGNKATGQATFYNLTGRPQSLAKNMDLINDRGIVFVVKEDTAIPSARVDDNGNVVAGEITVAIEAKEPGENGNVGPGQLNLVGLELERQEKIYGEIKNSLSGGTSKKVTVVTQEDLDNAQNKLFKILAPKVKEKIKNKAGEKMFVAEELIKYDDSELMKSVEVDKETSDFEAGLNLKAKALVYNNKELHLFLRNKIMTELGQGQTIAESEFGNLEIKVNKFEIEAGLADLLVKATFPVAENINLVEIKSKVLGKNEKEARRYILSLINIKDVRFVFSLNLRNVIPQNENRVKIKLGE